MSVNNVVATRPTARPQAQAAPTKAVAAAAAAPQAGGDKLATGMPKGGTPSLREQIAMAEKMMGKPSHFKTEAQLQAYLASMEKAVPQAQYDPQGFLASLGITGIRAAGRTDVPAVDAVREQPGYVPNDDNTGKTIWIQGKAFDALMAKPRTVLPVLQTVANPALEAKGKLEGKWKKPFVSVQKPVPTGVAVQDRYKAALAELQSHKLTFGPDVHGGLPDVNNPTFPTYGTYSIAKSMGFDEAAAKRIGSMCEGIDDNTTPYGKTSPMPQDQIDRHFNLDRGKEDTRLVYAQDHLKAAIALAKQSSYDQAEIELGCGLHSLQDLFAHGQISPIVHAVLGEFPDDVDWNPVAFYEATGATAAYLRAYLEAISKN